MKLIGEILCKMICLTQSQLEQALQEQKDVTCLLGRILIDHSHITEIQLRSALEIQKKTNRIPI